jgi:elongator complex protein 1
LYEAKQYAQASTVQLDYLGDTEGACLSLCKAYQYSEALRIASNNHPELLEKIDRALGDGVAAMLEFCADCKKQTNSQTTRLKELRIKKEEDEAAYYEGTGESDIPDNMSVAASAVSTSASLFTRYTTRTGTIKTHTSHRTSKNVRREERKRARGKKGSIYEEEYLVNSQQRLIERVNSTHDDMERLLEGLIRRRMLEQARAVKKSFAELIELLLSVKDEVFIAEDQGEIQHETARPSGPMGVLHDTIEGRTKKREVEIKPFNDTFALLSV